MFPHVSSEGGPIMLGDFDALRSWAGTLNYEAACQVLDKGNPGSIVVSGADCLVWDFGGPGTADIVLVNDSHISVVRMWPDPSWTQEQAESEVIACATERFGTEAAGSLIIDSGYLLALWAPEDAVNFTPPQGAYGIPTPGLSMGDSGVYVRVSGGRYQVTTCEWQADTFDVTKLDLRKVK